MNSNIEKFHDGLLTKDELLTLIKDDPDQMNEYRSYLNDIAIIKEGAKSQIHKQVAKAYNVNRTKSSNKRRILLIALMASVICMMYLFYQSISIKDHQDLYAQNFEVLNAPNARSNDENSDLKNAFELYNEGNYTAAIKQFSTLSKTTDYSKDEIYLFKGLSEMQLGEMDNALISFKKVSLESVYHQEAQWYSALALLDQGEIGDSKIILEKIKNTPKHYKLKEAVQIINELK